MAPRKRKAATDQQTGDVERKKKTARQPLGPTRITRGMTTDASWKAVLNTADLLENIIVHLPAKNIFGVQRACQAFRNVIKTSTGIQQKLLLRPSTQKAQVWELRTADGGDPSDSTSVWTLHSIPLKFVPWEGDSSLAKGPGGTSGASNSEHRKIPVRLNPLLKATGYPALGNLTFSQHSAVGSHLHTTLDLANVPLMQHQSWRDMLITDPPIPGVEKLHLFWRVKGNGRDGFVAFDSPGNATAHTLGSLVDAALDTERSLYVTSGPPTKMRNGDIISDAEKAKGNVARFNAHGDTMVGLRRIVVPSEEQWRAMEGKGEVV